MSDSQTPTATQSTTDSVEQKEAKSSKSKSKSVGSKKAATATSLKPKKADTKKNAANKELTEKQKARIDDPYLRIPKSSYRKMMRRGGVLRPMGGVYDESRKLVKILVREIVTDAAIFTENANRKTVTRSDMNESLVKNGLRLVGLTTGGSHTRKAVTDKAN